MSCIAVIDDGISSKRISDLEFSLEISNDLNIVNYGDHSFEKSHGTTCALIIRKYVPSAKIGSIKILDSRTKTGFIDKLKAAIEWCIKNDIKLINLSLGTTQRIDFLPLKEYFEYANKHNLIVIAAASNENAVSYPSSFLSVIGVKADPFLTDDMYYMALPGIEGVDVYANSCHNIGNQTPISNSFAAPLITAKVDRIIEQTACTDIYSIKKKLNDTSFRTVKGYDPAKVQTIDEILLNSSVMNTVLNIPCIAIISNSKDEENKANILNQLFIEDGYNSVLLSTEINSLVSIHINVMNLNDKNIAFVAQKFEADVVLIDIYKHDVNKSIIFSCDLLIGYIPKDELKIKIKCEASISPNDYSNNNILYRNVKKTLL